MGATMAGLAARFALVNEIGAGANGTVFRVHDRLRGHDVALKVLRSQGGRELYRFKREFRALADLAHPNLVALYELLTRGDEWSFTMQLVEGVPFNRYVRFGGEPQRPEDTGPTSEHGFQYSAVLDVERLRDALGQLADALVALHAAGKLHRDLKPTNILVEESGRVVILDLGLVTDLDAFHLDRTHESAVVGTPAYMSPEQAEDRPLTDASDWYSVGCILYEALVGRRPFEGNGREVLIRKRRELPVPPSSVDPTVPADLDALCMELLQRDPLERPVGRAVLAALGKEPSSATRLIAQQAARGPFVGRGAELVALRRSIGDSRHGPVAVIVMGWSGIGKTALVRAFLDEVTADGEALVLEARCFEREAVPFKALDGAVDNLTSWLVRLPSAVLQALLPRDVGALARLFPVMRRVPGVSPRELLAALPADPLELRRAGFHALRDLLAAIADSRPVVVSIDDLQWGDNDSASFLIELLHKPEARVLVIATHRSEEDERGAVLATLRARCSDRLRELTLDELSGDEAAQLWRALGGAADDATLHDAVGSPLLIGELARSRQHGATDVTTVEAAVRVRLRRLDETALRVVRAVALAGNPIPVAVASAAAAVDHDGDALLALRADRLVRIRGGDVPMIEPFHDRICEGVVADMTSDELRELHARLARALASEDRPDRELIVEHWLGAGDGERASLAAQLAADAAAERLAFHRAADLYSIALLNREPADTERLALLSRRARCLAAAGRLDEAAAGFGDAAELAATVDPQRRFELTRLAVEQLLRAGRIDPGFAAAQRLLGEIGQSMPRTWRRTLLALLVERARIRLRGLDFVERAPDAQDSAVLDRLDVLWSLSSGFTVTTPVLGRVLQGRFLREALDAGEPRRVAMAYALEIGYLAMPGEPAHDRTEQLLARATEFAKRLDQPDLAGFIEACGGIASYLCGRFREAEARLRAGERLLRDHGREMRWQTTIAEIFRTTTLWYLGRFRELVADQAEILRAAEERGDVYSQRSMRAWRANVVWLIQDQADVAREQAALGSSGRSRGDHFHLHHYYELIAKTWIELYEGRFDEAHDLIEGEWRELEGSHLLRIQTVDVEANAARASAAIGHARQDPGRIEIAQRALRRIDRHRTPHARVVAAQIGAAVAFAGGHRKRAVVLLDQAITAAIEAGMLAYAAATKLRLAQLYGDSEGQSVANAAIAEIDALGAAEPLALVRLLCPWVEQG